jgi:uncharacterized protein
MTLESLHLEALAWYDHWLKGKETGILEGPPTLTRGRNANPSLLPDQLRWETLPGRHPTTLVGPLLLHLEASPPPFSGSAEARDDCVICLCHAVGNM